MLVYGLTGGIASGKSLVAELLRARGDTVIDADALARELTAPGTPLHAEILAAFGDAVRAEDGTLDRRALRRLIFSEASLRAKLDALTHPAIFAELERRLEAECQRGATRVFVEAALIIEAGWTSRFDALIVVDTSEALQRARLMARDGASEAQTAQALASQAPRAVRLANATYILENNGTRAELEAKLEALLARL